MTQLSDKEVVLRKQARCFGCCRTFQSGQRMRKIVTRNDDGCLDRTAWCKACDTYWSKYMDYGDEIMQGDLKYEDPEGWEEVRQAVEETFPQALTGTLAEDTSSPACKEGQRDSIALD